MWKNNGIDEVQKSLLEKNTISLGGEVDHDMFLYVREALLRLIGRGSPAITVLITSRGGSVKCGLDIYDALRSYPGEKTIIVHAYACSMAAVILQSGTRRVAMRHADILIHHIQQEQISLDVIRSPAEIAKMRNVMEKDQLRIYEILAGRTKRTVAEIQRVCVKDRKMTSEQAKALRLIDEIR